MGEGSSEFFFTPALEKYHDVYQIKSNQIFIARRLEFIQYKYHIEKYNPREGKLIWGARFS